MTNLRLRYQTIEFGDTDIHVCTLRDKQEFYDPDGLAKELGISSALWPLFGVVWPSSHVLAHYIFGTTTGTKRILEVGCGIGLTSLLLNKLSADITATDYHPETQYFLERNAQLNGDHDIAFERTDWADHSDSLGLFDLIIGSDLLYEVDHIDLLANFIDQHSKSTCEAVIVDPGRGRKNRLISKMIELGFETSTLKPSNTNYLDHAFKGHILRFLRFPFEALG